jgi:hypothetical protein
VLPFLYFFMLFGLDGIISTVSPEKNVRGRGFFRRFTHYAQKPSLINKILVWAIILLIAAVNIHFQPSNLHYKKRLGRDWLNFYSCADWIRINTPPGANVMCRKPELFYVRSKHPGIVYPFTRNTKKIIDAMDSSHVSYVILDSFAWTGTSAEYLYPAIAANPERFKIVYTLNNPPTIVYEVVNE